MNIPLFVAGLTVLLVLNPKDGSTVSFFMILCGGLICFLSTFKENN